MSGIRRTLADSPLREAVAGRLDGPADLLLERLISRRLKRQARTRLATSATAPSEWNPEIAAAQEDLIRRYAPGRSFADIACMWGVDGACAFLAEEAGATAVTAMDRWPPTPAYLERHASSGSAIRFVEGDIHDQETVDAVGPHDVIWCSGLMYHMPDPVFGLRRLLQITRDLLIVGTKTFPAIPGIPGVAVYYPSVEGAERARFGPISHAVSSRPFERDRYYVNWFWGLSPQALAGMARSLDDLEVVEEVHLPWRHRHDDLYLVLRRGGAGAEGHT